MRVLHVITGLNKGGAEGVLHRLVTSTKDSISHTVVSLSGEGFYGSLLKASGVDVHALDMTPRRLPIRSFFSLIRLIRQARPDVVQTWMYHADLVGGIAARIVGVRAITWGIRRSNLDSGSTKWTTLGIARTCAFFSWFVPVRIVTCARVAIDTHRSIGYKRSLFTVIPNGYDCDVFQESQAARTSFRREFGLADGEFVLGMLARFDPQKDHRNLLRALQILKEDGLSFACLLAGPQMDGANTELVALISFYGLEDTVRLLGAKQDVVRFFNGIDIHVLSSLGEGFPNVVAEAMACATLCVVTEVGDAALIVGDTGWVCQARDPHALARSIAEASLLKDTSRSASRRNAARDRIVRLFSLEGMVSRYVEVWRTAYLATRPDR